MLRNVCTVRLLRRLCLHNSTAAPPVTNLTGHVTCRKHYTLDVTSRETSGVPSDGPDKATKGPRLEKGTRHRSKRALKGKVLHSRVLSESEKTEQSQIRREMQMQPDEELFGSRADGSTYPKSQPKKKAKHKRSPLEKEKRQKGVELNDKQVDLAVSDGVGEAVGSSEGSEDWGDLFGTMVEPSELGLPRENLSLQSQSQIDAEETAGSDDEDDHIRLREFGRSGHNAIWYGRQIEKLGKQGKVFEAIQMLEEKMLKEDRVAPNEYVFTVVIGICGRAGYTKKAFNLFNKMKKYGIRPDMPTYTALFNACANSPWREDGASRANRLLQQMQEKGIEPNTLTLKAVLKAYGRFGDLQTAFRMVDQMLDGGHVLDAEGWSHLLMACISDKEAGFKHVIEVWRLMRKKKIQPEIYQYNLLLRAARDCGVGDQQFANQLLGGATKQGPGGATEQLPPPPPGGATHTESGAFDTSYTPVQGASGAVDTSDTPAQGAPGALDTGAVDSRQHRPWWEEDPPEDSNPKTSPQLDGTLAANEGSLQVMAPLNNIGQQQATQSVSILDSLVPNILNPRGVRLPKDGSVVALGDLGMSSARLALLGGVPGVLSHMHRDGVKPDIRTFAQLLDMVPLEAGAEEDLLVVMTSYDVKADADLLNGIIRRRCHRRDVELARDVLPLFAKMELMPNLMTFASLALGCYGHLSGNLLLRDMQRAGFLPTADIFGILLRRSAWDFRYKKALCEQMLELGVSPNVGIIEKLETEVETARKALVKREKGQRVEPQFARAKFAEEFEGFMLFYKKWLLKSPLEQTLHPWTQYRQPRGGQSDLDEEEADR